MEGLMRTKGWQGAEMAGLAGRSRTPRATDAREGTRWFAERCEGANGRAIRRNGSEADVTGSFDRTGRKLMRLSAHQRRHAVGRDDYGRGGV